MRHPSPGARARGISSSPMKVLVLTNMYPPHHYGGYELSCRDVMDRFRLLVHDVPEAAKPRKVQIGTGQSQQVTGPKQDEETQRQAA